MRSGYYAYESRVKNPEPFIQLLNDVSKEFDIEFFTR